MTRKLSDREILHLAVARSNVHAERSTGRRVVATLVKLIDELTKAEREDSLSAPREKPSGEGS